MRVEAEVSRGRNLGWLVGAIALSSGLLVMAAIFARHGAITPAALVATAGAATLLALVGLARFTARGKRKRRVGADGRGLSIDGALAVPRHALARTRVMDEPEGGCSVLVERGLLSLPYVIHLPSARIAQALADDLEQAPRDRVEFEALPPWAHRMRWLAIVLTTSPWILINVVRHLPSITIGIVVALYALIGLPMIVPQKVAIGEDGVLLRWAGRERFVPFGLVRDARATPLGILLELAGDRPLEIRLSHRDDAEAARRAAMLERIRRGLAEHRALARADDEALLARGARTIEAWVTELTQLGDGDALGYRACALPRERLWAILEHPAAEASARQGAAIALRARLDDDERRRLREVGQKSVSPRLRVAIDAVSTAGVGAELCVALAEAERTDEAPARAIHR